jgi:hypothetical protein
VRAELDLNRAHGVKDQRTLRGTISRSEAVALVSKADETY